MKFEIEKNSYNKDEIIELFESIYDFQDEFIDSNLDNIIDKLIENGEENVAHDADIIWLNSYIIITDENDQEIKLTFDKFVKLIDEDGNESSDFKSCIEKLNNFSETVNVKIEFEN